MAHQINLYVKDLLTVTFNGEKLLSFVAQIQQIAKKSKKAFFRKLLEEEIEHLYGTGVRSYTIKNVASTRWNSVHSTIASMLRKKRAIINASASYARTDKISRKSKDKCLLNINESFMAQLKDIELMLRPLTKASLQMQRNSCTLGDVFRTFLEVYESYEGIKDERTRILLQRRLSLRWHDLEQPKFLLAFTLSTKYNREAKDILAGLASKLDVDATNMLLVYAKKFQQKHLPEFEVESAFDEHFMRAVNMFLWKLVLMQFIKKESKGWSSKEEYTPISHMTT